MTRDQFSSRILYFAVEKREVFPKKKTKKKGTDLFYVAREENLPRSSTYVERYRRNRSFTRCIPIPAIRSLRVRQRAVRIKQYEGAKVYRVENGPDGTTHNPPIL